MLLQSATCTPPLECVRYVNPEQHRLTIAYDKVSNLIVEGKCEEARRLAAFYGYPRISDSVRKACPVAPAKQN